MINLCKIFNFGLNRNIISNMGIGSYTFVQNCAFDPFCLNISNFLCGGMAFSNVNQSYFNSFPMSNNFNLSIFNSSFSPSFPKFSSNFVNLNFSPISSVSTKPSKDTKTSVGYIHWSKMDDSQMREFFGNYDYDVTQKFKGTAEDLNKFLEKYPNSELRGKGQVFIDAQNKYNISALVLLAICGAETSYGTKGIAVERHNFVNIEKEKGASYDGRWRKFENVEDCIMELARLLRQNYVDSPGKGKVAHLSKLYQIAPKYCPAKEDGSGAGWAKLVDSCMNNITKTINA